MLIFATRSKRFTWVTKRINNPLFIIHVLDKPTGRLLHQ